jgi:hypothetical protein
MSAPDTTADASPLADAARIRELMLANVFAVFGERDPERRSKAIAANYTDYVIWTDPDGTTQGRQPLNEGAQKLIDRSPILCSRPRGRSTSAAIWASLPSTWGYRSGRLRSAASTWPWCAMDGSPSCIRS